MARFVLSLALAMSIGCRSAEDRNATHVANLVRNSDYNGLASLLSSPDKDLKCRAAKALSWVQSESASTAHAKLAAMTTCGWLVRAEALWRLTDGNATGALATLVIALRDPAREMRWNAAKALAQLADRDAIPHLEKCASDPDAFVAAWCKWSECKLSRVPGCQKPNMDLTKGKPAP